MLNTNLQIISHSIQGEGRSYIVLIEKGSVYETEAQVLQSELKELGQIHLITIPAVSEEWREQLEEFIVFLDQQGIRNATFIAFEDASVLVQALCLKRNKLVRTLVFIDGSTRAHPSLSVKIVEKIESYLPLGLPFRSDFKGFDGKPFLQRIRAPVLIVLGDDANDYRKIQTNLFLEGMPTAFLAKLARADFAQNLARAIKNFQAVPPKMPQKNIR